MHDLDTLLIVTALSNEAATEDHGAVVHTLDLRLADAGPVLGVPTHLLT
jgi:hypothetical protein